MQKLRAIYIISRPINFIITFFAVIISGSIYSTGGRLDLKIILAAFAMAFACSAGNIINDIYDLEIDKINKPKRVLPKQLLSITNAKLLYFLFFSAALILGALNGMFSFAFILFVEVVIFLYSDTLKKIVLIGNVVVALLTASALIYGTLIVGNLSAGLIPAIFAFFVNFIRELIKDMEDLEGDTLNSIITFPIKYGMINASRLIYGLIITVIIITTLPFYLNIYKMEYFIIIMVIVNPIFVYIIKLIQESKDKNSLNKASSLIKLNMVFGLFAILLGV
jgi:geranylgeranylglycerol-phosphate geranylgeranyltransferase